MLGSLTDPQGLLDEAGGSLLGSIDSTEGPPSQWNTPVVTQEGIFLPPAHPLDTIRQERTSARMPTHLSGTIHAAPSLRRPIHLCFESWLLSALALIWHWTIILVRSAKPCGERPRCTTAENDVELGAEVKVRTLAPFCLDGVPVPHGEPVLVFLPHGRFSQLHPHMGDTWLFS